MRLKEENEKLQGFIPVEREIPPIKGIYYFQVESVGMVRGAYDETKFVQLSHTRDIDINMDKVEFLDMVKNNYVYMDMQFFMSEEYKAHLFSEEWNEIDQD